MYKFCPKCKQELDVKMFGISNRNKDKLQTYCKECYKIYRLINKDSKRQYDEIYRKSNQNKLKKYFEDYYKKNRSHKLLIAKLYRQNNIDKVKESDRLKYLKNKEKIIQQHKIYTKNNRNKINLHALNRKKSDISFRILCNLRNRLNTTIRRNYKQTSTINLLGCSVEFLKQHLEKQFKPGMSWSNYGKWHIDHKIPCASFDLSKPEEQRKCFHYNNLQPLWAKENIIKNDRILIKKEF